MLKPNRAIGIVLVDSIALLREGRFYADSVSCIANKNNIYFRVYIWLDTSGFQLDETVSVPVSVRFAINYRPNDILAIYFSYIIQRCFLFSFFLLSVLFRPSEEKEKNLSKSRTCMKHGAILVIHEEVQETMNSVIGIRLITRSINDFIAQNFKIR